MPNVITDFHRLPSRYETAQEAGFNWLIQAHTHAETLHSHLSTDEAESFKQQIKRKLHHVGCSPAHIEKRGHEIADFTHGDWDAMEVYRLNKSPEGASLKHRQELHQELVLNRFDAFFPENGSSPPDHLIHVTCTGYTSPSAPQIFVAKRGWENVTTLTPCYHLGCYGSIPALRLAGALLNNSQTVQIVHTELCTLHFNPLNHDLDQLVGQSLFADGWMKYTVLPEEKADKPYLKILTTRETIIPGSSDAMQWLLKDWGFYFKLSKEIPSLIAAHLKDFLSSLYDEELITKALFAIHPGGPKIIQNIQHLLHLSDEQVLMSQKILRRHGNMSSATLPHIWQALLNDPDTPKGVPVISLAFGPGLTLAGAVLQL